MPYWQGSGFDTLEPSTVTAIAAFYVAKRAIDKHVKIDEPAPAPVASEPAGAESAA